MEWTIAIRTCTCTWHTTQPCQCVCVLFWFTWQAVKKHCMDFFQNTLKYHYSKLHYWQHHYMYMYIYCRSGNLHHENVFTVFLQQQSLKWGKFFWMYVMDYKRLYCQVFIAMKIKSGENLTDQILHLRKFPIYGTCKCPVYVTAYNTIQVHCECTALHVPRIDYHTLPYILLHPGLSS